MNEKKPSNGGKNKNSKPWIVASSTILARRRTKPEVNWGPNCSLEKTSISLRGAEDAYPLATRRIASRMICSFTDYVREPVEFHEVRQSLLDALGEEY